MKRPKMAQDEGKDGSGMNMPESTLPSKKGRFRAVQGISAFFEGVFQDGFGAISRSAGLCQYCPMTSCELTTFSVERVLPHCRNRMPKAVDSLIFLPNRRAIRSFFCQKSIATD